MSQQTNTLKIRPISAIIGCPQPKNCGESVIVSFMTEMSMEDVKKLELMFVQQHAKAAAYDFTIVAKEAPKKHSIDWSQVNPKYDRIVTISMPHGKRYFLRGDHPVTAPQTRADAVASFVAGDVDDTVYRPKD